MVLQTRGKRFRRRDAAYLDWPMDITMAGHRPRSHSARPISLAERLEQRFYAVREISKNAQDRATGKVGRGTAWTLGTLDQDMYLCHTEEEVGGVGGER